MCKHIEHLYGRILLEQSNKKDQMKGMISRVREQGREDTSRKIYL
jgi:hypothetical protein